jgi:hypothetical protein
LSSVYFLGNVFADQLQSKLTHVYVTISKIEISRDAGKTWMVVFTGNKTHDLVTDRGKNVKVFGNTLVFGRYTKARTTVTSAKAELILNDGSHGEKTLTVDIAALMNMKYPIIDERDIDVNIEIDTVEKDARVTAKFYFDAEKSYSLKSIWDEKVNNYKITELKFDPVISVR